MKIIWFIFELLDQFQLNVSYIIYDIYVNYLWLMIYTYFQKISKSNYDTSKNIYKNISVE